MAFLKIMSDFLKNIFKQFIIIIFMLFLIFVVSPVLFITFVPTVIIKKLVSLLSKVIRNDLGKILTSMSSLLAADYFFHPEQICTAVIHFRCKGVVNIDVLKSKLVDEVIGIQKVGSDLKNIELKQYPYKWMGFIFWKWDPKFDISNHVKYYNEVSANDKILTSDEVEEIEHNLSLKQFPPKRSPWEIILIPNVQSESGEAETVVLFWLHHVIADGYSMVKFICSDLMGAEKENLPRAQFPRKNIFQQFSFYLKFLKMPYEAAENFVEGYDMNDWMIPRNEMSKTSNSKVSNNLSMEVIRNVKSLYNSSVAAVIFSAMTASMRTAMLKKNGTVPKYIHSLVPFPVKGHPDKLRNVFSMALVKLPVGEKDPVMRLRKIESILKKLNNSTLPTACLIVCRIIGCSFHWMISLGAYYNVCTQTMATSSLPGPKTKLHLVGNEVIDSHFMMGPNIRGLGMMFNTMTYNDYFKARLFVNAKILQQRSEVEEIIENMINEFYILKDYSNNIV